MTDVKIGGQFNSRTMADSGQAKVSSSQDKPKLVSPYLGDIHYLYDSGSTSESEQSVKVKVQVVKDSRTHKDENSELHDDSPDLFTCNKNERCCCRDIPGSGIFAETNQDALSNDSQSVIADNEMNQFSENFFGNSNCFMSRSFSSSSSEDDFDDTELPDFLTFDEFRRMHSDWDSGLSSNNNSHDDDEWSLAMSILGNFTQFENILTRGQNRGENEEVPPPYPHRAMMYHECQVCLTRTLLRRRVCCDFHICAVCMTSYVSMKVNEAKVQIECPNDRCNILIHRDEVNERLPKDMKDKFARFLVNANADPYTKTCPACSEVYSIEPKMLSGKKKTLKHGLKVQCPQCSLYWCFQCQAPFHTDMTCKQYLKGDKMVKKWAKELSAGQSNAQKCPKCNIFIQKVNGCDHMKCSRCNTDFCYRCGDRYIGIKLLGNHWSKFSLFGCKYRLMPKRPALRRLIRGANFAARLVAGLVLAGVGLAAGAVLVGASVVIVPGYGLFRLRRHLQLKEKRKRNSQFTIDRFPNRDRVFVLPSHGLTALSTQAQTENPDAQRVQVMVHRSISFTREDTASEEIPIDENYELYINKYTGESTDMVVSGISENDSEQVIVLTEVTEVQNPGGYPTVVAHIVSKMATDKEVPAKTKVSGKNRKEGSNNQSKIKIDPSENSLRKGDRLANMNTDEAIHKETSLAEGSRKKNVMSTADIPSCSWENLSGSGRVDSGYSEDESSQQISCEIKSGNLESDDVDNTKRGNNGCFGNIFSRRAQPPHAPMEYPVTVKSHMPGSQKKSLSHKAATWEKCHRDLMQSLLKSSPLDPVKDFNNLTSIMQNSSLSSVDLADMFNSDMKGLKTDFIRRGGNFPDSVAPDLSNSVSRRASLGISNTMSEFSANQHKDSHENRFINNSETIDSKNNLTYAECHIPLYSEVTHL